MRFLIIQENGRHERNRNFRECFSLQRALQFHGKEADVWGLGHLNYGIEPDFQSYDAIVNLENYDETGWVPKLTNVTAKKVLWSIDSHVKGVMPYIKTANEGQYDMILQAVPEVALSFNQRWFPNCYDDDLITPLKGVVKMWDIGFCGNINNRGPLLNVLDQLGLKRDIFAIGHDMVTAINSYHVHFNANISIDINYRNFETLGCKTCLLTSRHNYYYGLGFESGKNCLIYNSVDEMLELAKWAIDNDDKRNEIAAAGYELAKWHTYKVRAAQLLKILGELNESKTV